MDIRTFNMLCWSGQTNPWDIHSLLSLKHAWDQAGWDSWGFRNGEAILFYTNFIFMQCKQTLNSCFDPLPCKLMEEGSHFQRWQQNPMTSRRAQDYQWNSKQWELPWRDLFSIRNTKCGNQAAILCFQTGKATSCISWSYKSLLFFVVQHILSWASISHKSTCSKWSVYADL